MGLVQRGGVATVHNLLTGRGESDSHPISAVTGLTAGLTALGTAAGITVNDANEHFTAENVENALDELFTNVSNGKIGLVTDITVKGGTVSPIGDVPTFSEIGAGITSIPQLDTTDATATAPDLLATKTAYVNGSKVTGSMTNRGAVNITPGTAAQTIAAGYHNGSGTVAGDADLIAANIKSGTSIFGVDGNYTSVDTSDATAAQGEILATKTAYIAGGKVTGSMTNRGAVNITPGTATQTIAAGYHNGSGTVAGDADLIAANIVSGKNIFNVAGAALALPASLTAGDTPVTMNVSNATYSPGSPNTYENTSITLTINKTGNFRIYSNVMIQEPNNTLYWKIYKNGVAAGAEHSVISPSGKGMAAVFTDDLSLSAGDVLTIWVKVGSYGTHISVPALIAAINWSNGI